MPNVKIDCHKIPSVDMRNLSHVFCADMKKSFNSPTAERDFKAWQKERKKEVDSSAKKKT